MGGRLDQASATKDQRHNGSVRPKFIFCTFFFWCLLLDNLGHPPGAKPMNGLFIKSISLLLSFLLFLILVFSFIFGNRYGGRVRSPAGNPSCSFYGFKAKSQFSVIFLLVIWFLRQGSFSFKPSIVTRESFHGNWSARSSLSISCQRPAGQPFFAILSTSLCWNLVKETGQGIQPHDWTWRWIGFTLGITTINGFWLNRQERVSSQLPRVNSCQVREVVIKNSQETRML